MIAKIFIALVALMYIALAIWCTVQPAMTSSKVGFDLKGGSGQSEFMTVYGGLEFGLGVVLLLTLRSSATVHFGLLACIVIHGSLVVFRTLSFLIYSDIGGFTYRLAIGEWVIALVGIAILLFGNASK